MNDLDTLYFDGKLSEVVKAVATFPAVYNLSKRELYQKVLDDLKNGVVPDINPDLYEAYSQNLRKAVSGVVGDEAHTDMAAQFNANVSRFAAYKAYHATRELADLEAGEIDTKGKAILNKYNRWQAAEYNTATARARTARQYHDFTSDPVSNELYPNLKWLPSRSANPREEHIPFYGLVLPKGDDFWTHNQPGTLWNCKCDWEETDDPVNTRGLTPKQLADYSTEKGAIHAQGLEGNPAKTGKIFTDECPYVKNAGKHGSEIVEEFFRPIEEHHKEYISLHNNPDYKDVDFDWKTGGVKATHVGHEVHSADKEETFFKELTKDGKGLTSTQLEYKCQDILYRLGNSAILCEEGIINTSGSFDTALDLLLNGKRTDIRSITTPTESYRNRLVKKNIQLGKFNSLSYVTEKADSICLYFHKPSMFSSEKMKESILELKKIQHEDKETGELKHINIHVKHIYCVINEGEGKMEIFNVE